MLISRCFNADFEFLPNPGRQANWQLVCLQRYIVRIIFMVPLSALMSFLSMIVPQHSIYFDSVRDWWALGFFVQDRIILSPACYVEYLQPAWKPVAIRLRSAFSICYGMRTGDAAPLDNKEFQHHSLPAIVLQIVLYQGLYLRTGLKMGLVVSSTAWCIIWS